jgi:FKBP-type peptidyl-prolyl cis-trans isomerase
MNKFKTTLAFAAVAVLASCQNGETNVSMETQAEKFSYSLGMDIGKNIQDQAFDSLNVELVAKGVKDVLGDKETAVSFDDSQEIIRTFLTAMQAEKAEVTIGEGSTFLTENGQKEGVVTTESGLQYEVIVAGEGAKPAATNEVKVHYHGTLTDGTVFDSSVDRGQPASFPLNRVIPGWTEGVQLMSVGSKYRFTVPSELAYGEAGAGQLIGPNAVLIFEVELLEIL